MIDNTMKQVLEVYNQGLVLYKEMRFKEALSFFEKAISIKPDDGPSIMYKKRCIEFIEDPPPKDWNGVYIMKTK